MKTALKITLIGFVAGFAGAFTFYNYFIKNQLQPQQEAQYNTVGLNSSIINQSSNPVPSVSNLAPVDFSEAAAKATQSVVYINSISEGVSYSAWDWFFNQGSGNQ